MDPLARVGAALEGLPPPPKKKKPYGSSPDGNG